MPSSTGLYPSNILWFGSLLKLCLSRVAGRSIACRRTDFINCWPFIWLPEGSGWVVCVHSMVRNWVATRLLTPPPRRLLTYSQLPPQIGRKWDCAVYVPENLYCSAVFRGVAKVAFSDVIISFGLSCDIHLSYVLCCKILNCYIIFSFILLCPLIIVIAVKRKKKEDIYCSHLTNDLSS